MNKEAMEMPDCWVVIKNGQIIATHNEPAHLDGIQAVRYVPAPVQQDPVAEVVHRVIPAGHGTPQETTFDVKWIGVDPFRWTGKLYTSPQPAQQQDFSDAYQGAREDLAIWKKRALAAEDLNRKFIADINGQTFMGEPAQRKPLTTQEIREWWASENGLEDCAMSKLNDFEQVVRAIESKLKEKNT
jgi:hypothetical protein